MRISDWSSDVCSSDLLQTADRSGRTVCLQDLVAPVRRGPQRYPADSTVKPAHAAATICPIGLPALLRSEEHTSELQSLMRTSYAVFCLKKKKTTHNQIQQSH